MSAPSAPGERRSVRASGSASITRGSPILRLRQHGARVDDLPGGSRIRQHDARQFPLDQTLCGIELDDLDAYRFCPRVNDGPHLRM